MIYLFFIAVGLAAFHLVWEGILAPSFRLGLRFELFRLRDELRWLHHEQPQQCDEELYRFLQGSVNNGLRLLPRTDFVLLSSINEVMGKDEGLRRRIEKRRNLIEESDCDELKAIQRKLQNIARRAFAINVGGWMIYVVPLVGALASLGAINRFIKNTILIPESELEKVAPMGLACA